ncbi:hypothetical protein [Thalassotalea sediminis]|uniref:hypothetical protein n=1 Tax=Thalassotalea sediminis TaxID=1759089 RepID=UPI00257236C3|nr:hypothetical protein [Thalassotalea sediminis]
MQKFNKVLGILILSWASLSIVNSTLAANEKSFGKSKPFALDELPPGLLKQQLKQLPEPAKKRAVNWLHQFDFTSQDVATLRADMRGGIFYEDPIATDPAESFSSPVLDELSEIQTFTLHSKPGASRVVYLDMDGRVVTGTQWNANTGVDPLYMRPYDLDGNDANFSQNELNAIAETWRRIAEDFAPFDIDVTTEEPSSFGPQVGVILVTPKTDINGNQIYNCSCGGVAYVGVWGASYYESYQPALVFTDGVGKGPHNIAEAASHELGHNLSLSHDGTSSQGYYSGHGSGNTSWAPIMGVGYYKNVTQWSKGEYQGASQLQDDLQLIADRLSYRLDDHENNNATFATPLIVTNSTDVIATNPVSDPSNAVMANKGIIEHRNDVDLFSFDVGEGDVNLVISPAWISYYYDQSLRGMNLDINAVLFDESGNNIVASSTVVNDTYAQISATVSAGRYILSIKGVGDGDVSTTGYSDYGSIGQYFINGTVPAPVTLTEKPPTPSQLIATLSNDTEVSLSWIDPVASNENNESGYRVLRAKDAGVFVEIATIASNSVSYTENITVSGNYVYRVVAYNALGESASNDSNAIVVDVPVAASVAVATSEQNSKGSIISGTITDTHQMSGEQVIGEQHQGGKPSRRISELNHMWTVSDIVAGNSVMLNVVAQATENSENDNFIFEYSVNNSAYQQLGILYQGTGMNTFVANLPADTVGELTLRVTDTDKTTGYGSIDSVSVKYIAVITNGDAVNTPPDISITSPSDNDVFYVGEAVNFIAQANDGKDGDLSSNIQWSSSIDGALGQGSNLIVDDLTADTHQITARVSDSEGSSSAVVTTIVIAENSNGIALSVSANKQKGQHVPLLSWSNAPSTLVDIYRNGNLLTVVENNGSFEDKTGNKGSATYRYQVCEQDTSQCSSEVTVVY